MLRVWFLMLGTAGLALYLSVEAAAQEDDTILGYWGRLLDPNSGAIAHQVKITTNVTCTATWRTPEFYITRKMVQLASKNLSSQEVNRILVDMFENEVPKDREVFTIVFRWFPNGPEYTLPPDMAAGAVLYNERGVRVLGQLQEQLAKDLTLRANGGEYRSMILGFKREVPQGHRGAKVNILENTETITLELPRITKAGKPVSFTWKVKPDYPTRPLEMALLVDFPPEKFRIVW